MRGCSSSFALLTVLAPSSNIQEKKVRAHRYPQHDGRALLPALNLRATLSPTVVVALSGPGLFPRSWPNFDQVLRSATVWSTTSFFKVRLILRVIWVGMLDEIRCLPVRSCYTYLDLFTFIIHGVLYCRPNSVFIDIILSLGLL